MLIKETNKINKLASHVTGTLRKKLSSKNNNGVEQFYECDWCKEVFSQSVRKSSGEHPVSNQVVCPNGHFIKTWS